MKSLVLALPLLACFPLNGGATIEASRPAEEVTSRWDGGAWASWLNQTYVPDADVNLVEVVHEEGAGPGGPIR